MRTFASLLGLPLIAASLNTNVYNRRDGNASSVVTLSSSTILHDSTALQAPSSLPLVASSDSLYEVASSSLLPSDTPSSSSLAAPPRVPGSHLAVPIYTNRTSSTVSPVTPTIVTYTPSGQPPLPNITTVDTNSPRPTGVCTGCVLAAYGPITTSYEPGEFYNPWTSIVVTETIVTQYATYMQNNTVETVVTEERTVNQTKTLTADDNRLITRTAPTFTVQPTPGVFVHLEAGPTYVIYNRLSGAVDKYHEIYWPGFNVTEGQCSPEVTPLTNWEPASTATKEWNYFIETLTGELPESPASGEPVPLPSKLIEYLKQDPDIQTQFSGSDIATCSLSKQPESFQRPKPSSTAPPPPAEAPPLPTVPIFLSPSIGTYLATSYESTSVHITVRGCLRCQDTSAVDVVDPTASVKVTEPSPNKPDRPTGNTAKPTQDGERTRPNTPGVVNTFNNNNPSIQTNRGPDVTATKSVTVGGVVLPVNTPKPTQAKPDRPDDDNQNPLPPVIIIGSETLTQGQTKTINGVPVVVPTNGGGTRIVVDGSTVALNPATTQGLPVLVVGGGTVTANSNGQYVLGTETLKPGSPPITVNGNTVSMGPNGMVIVNGATQMDGNAPAVTRAPALTMDGQAISATVVGGSTVFVVAPGQTLGAGSTLVVDGTTYSMPVERPGSTLVVNGQTTTLSVGQSAITLDGARSATAQVISGTTAYILAPGQTLTPGGVLTVSGTTYSMPTGVSGTVIVVNGQTKTLGVGQSVITLDGARSATVQVISGTTAYILAPGQTLTPGGVLTLSGTTYSMPTGASGTVIVVNGVTSTLAAGAEITAAPALTINGLTYRYTVRDGTTEYVLNDGTTLAPGSAVTIDGTTYSLDEQGTALIINGRTSTMPNLPKSNSASTTSSKSSSSTTSRDVGDMIASGIGETSRDTEGSAHAVSFDKWVEGLVIGAAGWLTLLL